MAYRCGRYTCTRTTTDGIHAWPLRCKSWRCPSCAERNKRRLLRRLRQTQATHLITLTCRPAAYPDPATATRAMSKALGHLKKRIARHFPGAPLEYVAIWERTKHGWPHLHISARTCYLPQPVLSRMWSDLCQSPVVDIRAVRESSGHANYLAKYLSKAPVVLPNMKVYRSTRAYFSEPGGLLGSSPPLGGSVSIHGYAIALLPLFFPYGLYYYSRNPDGSIELTPRPPPASSTLSQSPGTLSS